MKVTVERTSNWGCEEKPIDEAVLVNRTLHYQDRINVSSMEEAKTKFWYDEFISSGTNHREERGCIVRDCEREEDVWEIEIESLDDILRLFDKYGDIIIKSSIYSEYDFSIEIYDTYRE
ncbi:hypothetical protein [Prevotella sp. KH2C16]|uniref:hypothetical protein n=1 Tax=Prevotella sp. KH2C16 TaxID=1855325 RepID=UPI000B846023|nr:hypothetical protein [Prevotella sp. KH2C16]